MCIFAFRSSSSPSSSLVILFIHSAFSLWFFGCHILLKIVWLLLHPVVGIFLCYLLPVVDRIFFCCFEISYFIYIVLPYVDISCLNFWDETWWFLSLRVFGLLSSSLLLFRQRFGQYVLRPSSGVCRTQEPSRNFKLRPLLNPLGSPVRIPLAITGYKC